MKYENTNWENCKLARSYRNIKRGIENKKFENIIKSSSLCHYVKIRTFSIYKSNVFLYNSEEL